jgi:hypothetical protein
VLGPLFALAIALSDMTILGLGSSFLSLVLGTAIFLFLEREGLRELRSDRFDTVSVIILKHESRRDPA